jgi:predicted Zn-dependent protease
VRLQKGENPLLVKVGHEKGLRQGESEVKSNFHLRILDTDYARPSGVTVSLAPVKDWENSAPLSRLKPSPMADSVIRTLQRRMENPKHELEMALLLLRYYLAMEYTDKAEILAEKYLDRYPSSALLHGLYTEALLRGGKSVAAQVALRKAYRFCRKYSDAWGNELGITESYGNAKKTIAFIRQSDTHLKNSSTALLSLLRASLKLDQKAAAMVLLKRLESHHGLSEQVVKVLASFYSEQGKTAKLEKVLRRFLSHNRSNVHFYQLMADAAVRQGRISRAIKHYRDCIRYSPNNPYNYYHLADLHFIHKQSEKALFFIEECLRLMPASAIALNLKANILISLDKKEEAKAVLHNIIKFTQDDFKAWDHLRELSKKPSLEAMAPLPSVDSLIRSAQSWTPLSYKTGAILASVSDVFRYPSRCSSLRHFIAVYLSTQQAIDNWKEQQISYNSNFQVLTVNKAVSLKADGTEIPADVLHGQAVFKSLEPGDVIVMEWTVKNYYQGKMAGHVYGSESFQLTTPVYFSCLRLVTPVNDTIPFQVFGDSIRSKTHFFSDYRVRVFFRDPYQAPPRESYMATSYRGHQKAVYSTFKSWENIADWYLGLTGGKQASALEINRLAKALFDDAPQPELKVARVYDFITGNIRYSYVPFRQSGWVPQSAKDVLATRIGDCKDMANLAKILLEKGGISCDLVLVNTNIRYFHDHAYIGPNFNHCIIDYTLNGVRRFLDFTDNNLSYGTLPKSNQGAMALIVKKGTGNLITIPVDKPLQRVKSRKVISRLHENGNLECRMHSVRTGIFAGDFRYFLRFKSREEQSRHIHKVLSSSYPDMSLRDFQFDNLDSLTDTLRYEYEFLARNSVTFSGRTAIFPLEMPDVLSTGSFPVEEKRFYPVDMHMCWFDVSSLLLEGELVFPEKWRLIDLPPEVVHKSKFGSYSLSFQLDGNTIVFRRHAVFNCRNLVPVSDYPELSNFLKKISKSDAVHLVFFSR